MALNWKEINLILAELDLPGSFIRQIHQPDYCSLVFDLYRRKDGRPESFKLYISLSNPHARLHRLTRKIANPERPHRFAAFLRSNIRNGRILTAEQIAAERIIKMEVAREQEIYLLWIRLWATAANILVTDEAFRILDAFYRRPRRGEISGETYRPDIRTDPPKDFAVRVLDGSGDFNQKVERHFFMVEEEAEKQALQRRALKEIRSRQNGIQGRLAALRQSSAAAENPERLRQLADLLSSSLHAISKGDRWASVADYYNDNMKVDIELDPLLSPVENVEGYYRRYKKARAASERMEDELHALETSLESLETQERRLFQETDIQNLRRVAGTHRPVSRKETPGLAFETSGYQILVGRTAKENDALLRSHVKGNDYWFHARDFPGAYVFVKNPKKKAGGVPLSIMLDAGNLAILYSKAKGSGQGDVYYTQVKYLRRAKGNKRGLVIPTQEKNLFIKTEADRIGRLKKARVVY